MPDNRIPDILSGFAAFFLVDITDGYSRAGFRQTVGYRIADAHRTAGDQGLLAG